MLQALVDIVSSCAEFDRRSMTADNINTELIVSEWHISTYSVCGVSLTTSSLYKQTLNDKDLNLSCSLSTTPDQTTVCFHDNLTALYAQPRGFI